MTCVELPSLDEAVATMTAHWTAGVGEAIPTGIRVLGARIDRLADTWRAHGDEAMHFNQMA